MSTSTISGKVVKRYLKLWRRAGHPNTPAPEVAVCRSQMARLVERHPGLLEAIAEERNKAAQAERQRSDVYEAWRETAKQAAHNPQAIPRPSRKQYQATIEFVALMQEWGHTFSHDFSGKLLYEFERGVEGLVDDLVTRASSVIDTYLKDTRRKLMSEEEDDDVNRGSVDWAALLASDEDAFNDVLLEVIDVDDIELYEGDKEVGDDLGMTVSLPVSLLEAAQENPDLALAIVQEMLAATGDDEDE